MVQTILVVSRDHGELAGTLQVLNGAGFQAIGAETFEEASAVLVRTHPDLLIADERLGAYNGLHLVIRGRAASPCMRAIVATPEPDNGLETDARQLNATCFVKPADPSGWLDAVFSTLHDPARASA